jgi:hypothetical protein
MAFSHPLARRASVFTARNNDGSEYRVLAIATTLELDPISRHYKQPLVEKLSKAATEYLASSKDVTAFVLMNRPRDWLDHRERRKHSKAASQKPSGKELNASP